MLFSHCRVFLASLLVSLVVSASHAADELKIHFTDKQGRPRKLVDVAATVSGVNVDNKDSSTVTSRFPLSVFPKNRKGNIADGNMIFDVDVIRSELRRQKSSLGSSNEIEIIVDPSEDHNNLKIVKITLLLGSNPQDITAVMMNKTAQKVYSVEMPLLAYSVPKGDFHLVGELGTSLVTHPVNGRKWMAKLSYDGVDKDHYYYKEDGDGLRWSFSKNLYYHCCTCGRCCGNRKLGYEVQYSLPDSKDKWIVFGYGTRTEPVNSNIFSAGSLARKTTYQQVKGSPTDDDRPTYRSWKDSQGVHSIKAALIDFDIRNEQVQLRRKDNGRAITVKLYHLSPEDQQFLIEGWEKEHLDEPTPE